MLQIEFTTSTPSTSTECVYNNTPSSPPKRNTTNQVQSKSQTPSPAKNCSSPIKRLHWPKYIQKSKTGIGSKEKVKLPFAITSVEWQTIIKEKEDMKEELERKKLARKEEREKKGWRRKMNQRRKPTERGK